MNQEIKENFNEKDFEYKYLPAYKQNILRYGRSWMSFILICTDITSLIFASVLAVSLRLILGGFFQPTRQIINLTPILIIILLVYAWWGLYPAVGLSPVEELRRTTISTSVVFLIITAATFWIRSAEMYSRPVFLFSWILVIIVVAFNRWMVRQLLMRNGLWGEPVVVIGYGEQGRMVVDFLNNNLHLGIFPVMVIDKFTNSIAERLEKMYSKQYNDSDNNQKSLIDGIRSAILITSEMPKEIQDAIIEQRFSQFKRLILIPNLHWVGSVGVTPYDLEGFLGLEVRQNLLSTWHQYVKRMIDLGLVIVVSIVALPIAVLVGLIVGIDSAGSALFSQERIGGGERMFKMWKFRTMVENADQVLNDCLKTNPDALAEWRKTQKLKNDPRVTRVGRFLRRTSLDELPQLWNVFKGDMSLVGPRPIVQEEIKNYAQGYNLYTKVKPGLTGLWQVSGRNDVSYSNRVRYDEYYVRNWSIWLDIHILLRTGWTVIRGKGAY